MKLKFLSRDGFACPMPGVYGIGQPSVRVARSFVPAGEGKPARYVADKDPTEIDSESPDAHYFVRKCGKGEIWPADSATAAFCGVEFRELDRDTDGEWKAKASSAPKKTKPETQGGG